MPRALTLSVTSAGKRLVPPIGFAQAVPGTMVMFTMLVLLTSGAVTLVVEREQGLLRAPGLGAHLARIGRARQVGRRAWPSASCRSCSR